MYKKQVCVSEEGHRIRIILGGGRLASGIGHAGTFLSDSVHYSVCYSGILYVLLLKIKNVSKCK